MDARRNYETTGMRCPKCQRRTKILYIYSMDDDSVQRTRICRHCGHEFKTREIDEEYLMMLEGDL